MIRLIIVLPIYLVAAFLLPRTALYAQFAELVRASGQYMFWHLVGYGVGLAVGLIGGAIIEFGLRPERFGFDSVLRVLRIGFLGLIVTCGYQLFAFFTGGQLDIFILLVPPVFMVAEIIYEFVEYLIYRGQVRRQAASEFSRISRG